MQTNPRISVDLLVISAKNTSKSTSKTNQIRSGGGHRGLGLVGMDDLSLVGLAPGAPDQRTQSQALTCWRKGKGAMGNQGRPQGQGETPGKGKKTATPLRLPVDFSRLSWDVIESGTDDLVVGR